MPAKSGVHFTILTMKNGTALVVKKPIYTVVNVSWLSTETCILCRAELSRYPLKTEIDARIVNRNMPFMSSGA